MKDASWAFYEVARLGLLHAIRPSQEDIHSAHMMFGYSGLLVGKLVKALNFHFLPTAMTRGVRVAFPCI